MQRPSVRITTSKQCALAEGRKAQLLRRAALPGRPAVVSRSAVFSALDLIDNARDGLERTAVFSTLIDHDAEYNDPDLIGTMERHLKHDLAALRAAEEKARAIALPPNPAGRA